MTKPSRPRLRLLVADDSPINISYMTLLLEKMGHEATFCYSGREALELLQQKRFDALLLDYHMPGMDGLSTAKAFRLVPSPSSDAKVLLLTADVVGDVRQRALKAGVDRFVSKPLTMQDLNQALFDCGLLAEELLDACQNLSEGRALPLLDNAANWPPPAVDVSTYYQLQPFASRAARAQMVYMVLGFSTGLVDVLIGAMELGSQPSTEAIAHNLKGAAMLLGLAGIARAAAEIEGLAGQHLLTDLDHWKVTLRRLCEQSKDELTSLETIMEELPTPMA